MRIRILLNNINSLLWHYVKLLDIRGVWFLCDRIARRIFPKKGYEYLTRHTWMRPLSQRYPLSLVSLQRFENVTRDWFKMNFTEGSSQKEAASDTVVHHTFNFLGTGLRHWGNLIGWHQDVKSGYRWHRDFYTAYGGTLTPGHGVDIKVPWELSRCHHFVLLAQAWRITGDERYAKECFDQWEDWLDSNPWGYGINWTNTMEAAIRAVNWLFAFSWLADATGWTPERKTLLSRSLREHAIFIEHNLEVGIRNGRIAAANHYLSNVCGLAILGLFCPELPGANRWQQTGLKTLEQEMQRQVLKDGFFFESSTSYHRLAVELFLIPALLARRCGQEMSETYWRKLELMLEVILYLTRPDGNVPQIGDNDDGRLLILSGYPDWPRHDHRYLLGLGAVLFRRGDFKTAAGAVPEEIFWLLGRQGVEEYDDLEVDPKPLESRAFPEGGLHVIRSGDGQDYALVRTGVPAPHAPTGHAHNDTLSLELWIDGKPVFVDPGTYCYTSDISERNRFRSTAMHNTVSVGGEEINRIPPHEPFRMERDAAVEILDWHAGEDKVRLAAERMTTLHGRPGLRHQRTVTYSCSDGGTFLIEDDIAPANKSFIYWQLPYECQINWSENDGEVSCENDTCSIKIRSHAVLEVSMQPEEFAISFGRKAGRFILCISLKAENLGFVETRISGKGASDVFN